ncbi:MAG TPA: RNA polymerase sigma factor [Acidimicrobiales bacterium]|nr:RNA polymerase sigma factor [Acidimicrobiales bacterium]
MALRADDVDLCRDRDLVVRSQAGDDGAFEDLYRRYFGRLYRSCVRRLHDPHAAEEVAQEAFARAYRALPRLGGERKFYPWLSVIAARLCTDEFRRRARSEPAAVIDLGAWEGDHDRVIRAVDAEMLNQAMARLTPRHRDVLSLREHHGWSYQHIAEHLGVNLGTVEALLHRARKALKREFDVLAGPDAVPVAAGIGLGWFGRKMAALRLKLRVDEWSVPSWAPTVGNAMAAAAVVVGSTTMLTGGGNTQASAVTMSPAAAVAVAPTAASSPAAVPSAPATTSRADVPAATPKQPGKERGGSAVPPVGLGTQDVGVDNGIERTQEQEVNNGADGVAYLGANPTGAADEVVLTAGDYVDDLRKDSE